MSYVEFTLLNTQKGSVVHCCSQDTYCIIGNKSGVPKLDQILFLLYELMKNYPQRDPFFILTK